MKEIYGLSLTFIFSSISLLHLYWGLGGKWGIRGSIPTDPDRIKNVMNPGPFAFILVILGLLLMAGLSSIKAGLIHISIPPIIDRYGMKLISIVFLLRSIGEFKYVGLFKKIKNTEFARKDTRYYIPLCLIISVLAILLN